MIQEIEDALVGKLKELFPELDVEGMPDDISKYKVRNPKGAVLVGFARAALEDPVSEENTVQKVRFKFLAAFMLRNLRTHRGTYARLEEGICALSGFETGVADVEPVFASNARFIREFQGTWHYDLEITATAHLIY